MDRDVYRRIRSNYRMIRSRYRRIRSNYKRIRSSYRRIRNMCLIWKTSSGKRSKTEEEDREA